MTQDVAYTPLVYTYVTFDTGTIPNRDHAQLRTMPDTNAAQGTPESRIAVLCNPLSGRVRGREKVVRRLGKEVGGSRYREASNPQEISGALAALVAAGPEVLCLIGGDGTVQAAVTSLHSLAPFEDWPILAALPGGTTNMTAKDLGDWGSISVGLEALRLWGKGSEGGGKVITRPVLKIEVPGAEVLCGFFFGTGAVSAGVQFFQRRFAKKGLPGTPAVRLTIARLLWSLAPGRTGVGSLVQPLSLTLDGGPEVRHGALLFFASTLHRLLLDMRPYWGQESGSIHFTLVEEGARGLWLKLFRLARGQPGKKLTPEAGFHSRNVEAMELRFDGPFVIDGEVYQACSEAGPLRVSTLPSVRWLVP